LYDLKAFSTETLAESLANDYTTPSEVRDKNHFDYFLGYLIALDANTIIVEPDYVSKDYLHDYVSYYSLCHEKYPKTCKRVHFFSLPFSVQDFETWINNGIPSVDIRNSYLGFIVVRPIPNTVIGFTILKTYQYSTGFGQRNYWGIKQYSIHLFGVELKLNSLAFQEQDSVVSACATAAIWSMLHGAAARSANTVLLKSPSEITRDAGNSSDGSRVFPNKGGLDVRQICDSILKAGLVCEVITQDKVEEDYVIDEDEEESEPAAETKCKCAQGECRCNLEEDVDQKVPTNFLKKILNAYSLIGIPIILVIKVSEHEDHSLHANTVCGFFRSKPKSILPIKKVSFIADNIEKIYVHDDQWGPFVKVTFSDDDMLQTKWTEVGHEVSINSIIVPVYPKIRISYQEIESIIRGYDTILSLILNDIITEDLVWDIKLIMNQDYKEEIRKLDPPEDYPQKLKWLTSSLPRYIWMAHCYIGDHVILDFAFDATGVNQAMLGKHIICHLDDTMKKHLVDNLIKNKNGESFNMIHHDAREQYYNFLLQEISR